MKDLLARLGVNNVYDTNEVLQKVEEAANAGDAVAARWMGNFYCDKYYDKSSVFTPLPKVEGWLPALIWYTRAAELGDEAAKYYLDRYMQEV